MIEKNNAPYCIAPWVSIQYGALLKTGGVTPCCEWNGSAYKESLESYFTSDWLENIKSAMISHDHEKISQTCENCIAVEKLNIISTRQQLHNKHLSLNDGLRIIDYRPSNLCNLKCRMCFAENSSMIAKEENKVVPEYNTNDIYSIDFSNIIEIKIVGGEPSISDEVYEFLSFLTKSGVAQQVNLMFTTNATNANGKWIDLISKFKSCYVIISLDGIDKVYEYIRTNAKWNSVLKNIIVYQSLDVDINFQITASMYNMPVVEEWIEWFFDKNASIYPVEGRPELSLNALANTIKEEKIKYLSKFNNQLALTAIEIISNSSYNFKLFQKFKNYTEELDKKRNTSLRLISPVFKKLLSEG
jgi:sulfatase maturation enzyme AslB (radical SAM superfamily)